MFITPAFAQTQPPGAPEAGVNVPPVAPESPELGHGAPPEGAHTEIGHEGVEDHGGAFPPFDPTYFGSQLLWLAITFGFFYWVLSKKLLPRLGGILEVRQDRIGADLAEAERSRAETDAAIAAYEQALAEARQKAGVIATETRERLNADLDARRKAIEADLTARVADAETRISAIKAQALNEVDAIATETTDAIVATLIGQSSPAEAAAAVATVRKG
ncbi:F0F1 ATP synthase subunit B [Chthonobacter rhizosphaerae]|uniref:F0F1 ATP synthase subunit B n=1 Tax=Chthonobacter rhizosphaerae TaxID=2735553 RepID=UPI003CCCA63A